eukprot:350701_1
MASSKSSSHNKPMGSPSSPKSKTKSKQIHQLSTNKLAPSINGEYSLQLNVIRQPLSASKANKLATCCLCCVDLVGSLSKDERVMKLTTGYIRIHCKYEISPDLVQLCFKYVGSENEFRWRTLNSIKQEKKEKCQEKCWERMGMILYITVILSILGIYFGKDIAALIINATRNCDNALDGGSKYVNFGVSTWIWSGCITHLSGIGIIILVGLLTICDVNCFEWMDDCCDDMFDWDEDEGSKCCFTVLCGGPCCFAFCWLIIGFLLYSEMSRDSDTNLECSNVVLSWSILQIVESLISTGATCCFVIMDWDSD